MTGLDGRPRYVRLQPCPCLPDLATFACRLRPIAAGPPLLRHRSEASGKTHGVLFRSNRVPHFEQGDTHGHFMAGFGSEDSPAVLPGEMRGPAL